MGNVENGVQTLYYGLGIIFMLGGAVAAYVRALQTRVGKQERGPGRIQALCGRALRIEGIFERDEAGNS
jgi:hypothetical protein